MEPRQKWLTYLLTGILPFVLVINANFIQLENNHDNTVSMFLRRNISIQLRTFKESSFKQRTFILKTGDSIIHGEINLWLSGLANTGTSVKSEFQKTTNFFFFLQVCAKYCPGYASTQKLLLIGNISVTRSPIFFPATLDELEIWGLALSKTNFRYFFATATLKAPAKGTKSNGEGRQRAALCSSCWAVQGFTPLVLGLFLSAGLFL